MPREYQCWWQRKYSCSPWCLKAPFLLTMTITRACEGFWFRTFVGAQQLLNPQRMLIALPRNSSWEIWHFRFCNGRNGSRPTHGDWVARSNSRCVNWVLEIREFAGAFHWAHSKDTLLSVVQIYRSWNNGPSKIIKNWAILIVLLKRRTGRGMNRIYWPRGACTLSLKEGKARFFFLIFLNVLGLSELVYKIIFFHCRKVVCSIKKSK